MCLGAPPSRSTAVQGVEGVVLPLSDTKYQAPSQLQSCAWFDFDTLRRLELTQPALARRSCRSS